MRFPETDGAVRGDWLLLGVGASAERPTVRPAMTAPARRRAAWSRSARAASLLGYAKSQAARLVGPWGLGGSVATALEAMLSAAAATARRRQPSTGKRAIPRRRPSRASTTPARTSRRQGVDEPDLVKTDGKTLFAIANGMLERRRRQRREAAPARHAEARRRLEPRAAAVRRPPARALARRLLGGAASGDVRADDAVRAVAVRR